MRLRYMVESKLRAVEQPFLYDPIGVWVVGPGEGLDLLIRYLPGYEEEQAAADLIPERMRAAGMLAIPSGFLEYHEAQFSPYRGVRGPIITTDDWDSPEECARAVLNQIKALRENL
ncbi:MAG: hypothetical protein OXF62_11475 [Caldilineaceae bacterium]|nr:hypothetical protein [Caldilineaceae bacterium]